MSPDPARSTRARAISVTTRTLRPLSPASAPARGVGAVPSLMASVSSRRDARIAGTRPNSSPVASAAPSVNSSAAASMRISLPPEQYRRDSTMSFWNQLLPRLGALPGVQGVGVGNCTPLAGGCNQTTITFPDRAAVPRGTEPPVGVHFVTPQYFATLRVPLRRGRAFADADRRGAPKVVVINERAARRFFPAEDPIGKRVAVGQGGFGDGAEVIGVVGDVRFGTADAPPIPDVFISYAQAPRNAGIIFVRAATDPAALVPAVRREIAALDPTLPIYDVRPLRARVGDATARTRFGAALLAVFAALALLLSGLGIYGVLAFAVAQRTREIGIRIALGATRARVLRMVVRQGLALTAAGLLVGAVAALAATRLLASLLYEVAPSDPATYAAIALVLGAVAMLAVAVPALRATRVDPLVALRDG